MPAVVDKPRERGGESRENLRILDIEARPAKPLEQGKTFLK